MLPYTATCHSTTSTTRIILRRNKYFPLRENTSYGLLSPKPHTKIKQITVCIYTWDINSLRPNDAYRRQWTWSLDQIMAGRMFGAHPLSDPMLIYCQMNHKEHISRKFYLKLQSIHPRKLSSNIIWKLEAIFSRPQWAYPISSSVRFLHKEWS